MPYRIMIPKRVQHEIESLPSTVQGRVIQAIDHLKDDPRPSGCVKLKGHRDEYRIRVSEYRVHYEVRDADQSLFVLRVRHRGDVYGP